MRLLVLADASRRPAWRSIPPVGNWKKINMTTKDPPADHQPKVLGCCESIAGLFDTLGDSEAVVCDVEREGKNKTCMHIGPHRPICCPIYNAVFWRQPSLYAGSLQAQHPLDWRFMPSRGDVYFG